MRATTRRLVSVSALAFTASTAGAVLALAFGRPTQFDGSGKPEIAASKFATGGTATSIPVVPWTALAAFALLARSRRRLGTAAAAGLCLLAMLFFIGGMGEALAAATPHVPRAVLLAAGAVYALLAAALLFSGTTELVDRWRESSAGRAILYAGASPPTKRRDATGRER